MHKDEPSRFEVLTCEQGGDGLSVEVRPEGQSLSNLTIHEDRGVAYLEPVKAHEGEGGREKAGRFLVEVEACVDGKARGVGFVVGK